MKISKNRQSSWLGQVRVVCQIPLSYHERTQPKSWPTCCFNLDMSRLKKRVGQPTNLLANLRTSWPTHELVGQQVGQLVRLKMAFHTNQWPDYMAEMHGATHRGTASGLPVTWVARRGWEEATPSRTHPQPSASRRKAGSKIGRSYRKLGVLKYELV